MRTTGEAWIIDAARSPRTRNKSDGGLAGLHPQQLLASLLNATLERSGLEPADVEDVVVGCVNGYGEQGGNIARLAVLAAGWPYDTAAGVTVNRFCGSGQQAVNFAASMIMAGAHDLLVAGGVESLSRVAMGADRGGLHGHNQRLNAMHPLIPQGLSGDLIAALEGYDRDAVDEYAVESHRRAGVAQAEGRFERSLVTIVDEATETKAAVDEHPRPSTTMEGLARLEPSFRTAADQVAKGDTMSFREKANARYPDVEITPVHHAGNSSGMVDGAATVVLASPDFARAHGLTPRAKIVSMAVATVEPIVMLTAPAPTVERALSKAGMTTGDVDLFEVNEAFASVPLKFIADLDLDPATVNPNGGAIALGHPFGATGAILIGTVLDELERTDRTTGVATMCIGTGQGTATIIERI